MQDIANQQIAENGTFTVSTLGTFIRDRREQRGLSQTDLATALEMVPDVIDWLEDSGTSLLTSHQAAILAGLARVLQIDRLEILDSALTDCMDILGDEWAKRATPGGESHE